jgi:3-dehydroquinate synthetase
MCGKKIREEVKKILISIGLPTKINGNLEKMLDAATHDKKCDGDYISVIRVNEVGSFIIDKLPVEQWKSEIRQTLMEI